FIKYSPITSMKRVKISLIRFLLKQHVRKSKGLKNTVHVKGVINHIHTMIGASLATPVIFEKTLKNGLQAIKKLITLSKISKFMHGIIIWYWNGIRGQPFQRLKK